MTHVQKLSLCLSLSLFTACGTIADYEYEGELAELTVAECQTHLGAGNPFDEGALKCDALDPAKLTAADCTGMDAKTPWNPKWDPKLPVCFGFQGDINKFNDPAWVKGKPNPPPTKCNYLALGEGLYCYCHNYKYSMCAIAQKLPGMANGMPKGTSQIVPVTDPTPLTPVAPGSPATARPGATVREDCLFMQYCSNWPAGVTTGKPFACTIKAKPSY